MRKPNKNKMAGVNSRFASVSESIFNGFLLKRLLRSLPWENFYPGCRGLKGALSHYLATL